MQILVGERQELAGDDGDVAVEVDPVFSQKAAGD